nr:MAG TPA: hypothetical protein [Caudoviricetes sp.]
MPSIIACFICKPSVNPVSDLPVCCRTFAQINSNFYAIRS